MSSESAWDKALSVIRENIALAEPAVFVMGFAEGIPGLSLIVPSSALFLGIGGLHGAAGGTFWQLWIPASIGAVLGDCVTYAIGRRFKSEATGLPILSRYPGWLTQGRALLERWGVMAVVGGKFLGFMRPFVPVVAGVLEMPFFLFLGASIVSSFAWAGVFLAPGYGLNWFMR